MLFGNIQRFSKNHSGGHEFRRAPEFPFFARGFLRVFCRNTLKKIGGVIFPAFFHAFFVNHGSISPENFAKSDPGRPAGLAGTGRRTPDPKSAKKCLFSLVSFTLFFLQLPLFSLKTDPRTAKALDFRVVNHPFFPQLPFFSTQMEMFGLLGAHAPQTQAVSQKGVQLTLATNNVTISALDAYLESTQG